MSVQPPTFSSQASPRSETNALASRGSFLGRAVRLCIGVGISRYFSYNLRKAMDARGAFGEIQGDLIRPAPYLLLAGVRAVLAEAARWGYASAAGTLGERSDREASSLRRRAWSAIETVESWARESDELFSRTMGIRTEAALQRKDRSRLSFLEVFRRSLKNILWEWTRRCFLSETSLRLVEACGCSVWHGRTLFLLPTGGHLYGLAAVGARALAGLACTLLFRTGWADVLITEWRSMLEMLKPDLRRPLGAEGDRDAGGTQGPSLLEAIDLELESWLDSPAPWLRSLLDGSASEPMPPSALCGASSAEAQCVVKVGGNISKGPLRNCFSQELGEPLKPLLRPAALGSYPDAVLADLSLTCQGAQCRYFVFLKDDGRVQLGITALLQCASGEGAFAGWVALRREITLPFGFLLDPQRKHLSSLLKLEEVASSLCNSRKEAFEAIGHEAWYASALEGLLSVRTDENKG